MGQSNLTAIFFVVLLDIVGFSLLIPVLPYYAAIFGATPAQVGLLSGAYALCQFAGAPAMARLSDKYGRKPMLALDAAGSLAGFLLLGFASSLWTLFLSRCLAGCVAANVPIAQAYISDVTTETERSKSLGVIGAAFGVGFTIGPALGGVLSKSGSREGYALAAFAAAACAVLNLAVIAFFTRESLSVERRGRQTLRQRVDLSSLRTAFSNPSLRVLLAFWAVFSVAFATFQQNIALFNQYHLGINSRQSGYVFAYIGVLVSLAQGVWLGRLTKRRSDAWILARSSPVLAATFLVWAFTPHWAVLLVALAPLCFAGSALITVTNSALTKAAGSGETGGVMGISGAVDNASRVVASLYGGALIQYMGTSAPGIVAAALMLGLAVYARRLKDA